MIDQMAIPTIEEDFFSDRSILDPHAFDGRAREMAPVVWLERNQTWFIGRHEHVRRAFGDPATFSSRAPAFLDAASLSPPVLLSDDPPIHTGVRSAILSAVSPARVRAGASAFPAVAEQVVDEIIAEGGGDAYTIAARFVLKVFPDMLGLPADGRESLIEFGQAILNAFGEMNERAVEAIGRAEHGFGWIATQCNRENVAPDGLAADIYGLSDQGKVTEHQAGALVRAVLAAGFDTTILGLTSAIKLLAEHPDQWETARSNPAALRNAFEETLRLFPPGRINNRVVATDTEFEGVRLKAGDRVSLGIAASGRDPRKWQDPDTFDVNRRVAGHMSFGSGIHQCIGQVVARLEYEALLGAMARRIDRLELTSEPVVLMNNVTTGYQSVPFAVHVN